MIDSTKAPLVKDRAAADVVVGTLVFAMLSRALTAHWRTQVLHVMDIAALMWQDFADGET